MTHAEQFPDEISDETRAAWRRQVGEFPRIAFVCERDWLRGPNDFAIGFCWDRDFDAEPGDEIYQRNIILRWRFRIGLDWRVRR